jgi:tetratricopeptide (TPR) repeat protein
MKWKLPIFSLIIVLLFFIILELVLWLAGVPTLLSERDPFQGFSEQVRVFQKDKERGIYKVPSRAILHSFNYQEFKINKLENGFRLFVLGGSSAYGFPWGADAAFPRYLGEALQVSYPEKEIEAINASAMSYGSHRLRILISEILDYEPDLVIVYSGHNEFVERRFYRDLFQRPAELDRVRLLLYRWRLYSFMTRLYLKIAEKGRSQQEGEEVQGKTVGELLGLDVVREHSVDVTEREKDEAHRHFEENFRILLDQAQMEGVPVILCTVPSNISGWKPNQSLFAPDMTFESRRIVEALLAGAKDSLDKGDDSAVGDSVEKLERAKSLAPSYAEIHFLLGKAYEKLGQYDKARESYILARDTDAKPTRAESAVNDSIRRLASEKNIHLVDLEKRFEEITSNGLIGFNLIQDYVHPNEEGHRRIALELWKTLQEKGYLGDVQKADESAFWIAMGAEGAPRMVAQADAPSAEAAVKTPALIYNLAVILENQGHIEQAMGKYRECRDLGPSHQVEASASLGRLLHGMGNFVEAAEEYHRALEADSGHMKSLMGYAEALRGLGRPHQAREVYLRATQVDSKHAPAWNRLGVVFSEQFEFQEAEDSFRRAVELDPNNGRYLADLGFILLFHKGTDEAEFRIKIEEAETAFRKSIDLLPDHRRTWNGLAAVLTERGNFYEAQSIFQESLRIDPNDASARSGLQIIKTRQKSNQ